jgi:O-antigen ligase
MSVIATTVPPPVFATRPRTPAAPLQVLHVRPVRLHQQVVWQTAAAIVPAMALFGSGRLVPASWWLFMAASALVVWNILRGKPRASLALLVAVMPGVLLLREVFYYAAPLALLAAAIAAVLTAEPRTLGRLRQNRALTAFVAVSFLYWWASMMLNQRYDANIRVLELALTCIAVYLLAHTRGYLYSALCGLVVATFAQAAGFLPYGTRLGEGMVGGMEMGNPISLGLASALIFLLTLTESGHWIFAAPSRYWRLICNCAAGACLVLSTSRGGWLVALVCWLLLFCLDRKSRRNTVPTLLFGVVAVLLLLQSGRSVTIRKYFDITTSSKSSVDKITTGRADQWQVFPRVLADSPIGFGPGSGKAVSLRYTAFGKPWHSLYLHIGAELGLIGLGLLGWLLGTLLWRSWQYWRFSGEVVPLVGVVAFMLVAVSVTGLDGISGIYLGLAFLGADRWTRRTVRRATWRTA